MDFDDLDELEAAEGLSLEQLLDECRRNAAPSSMEFAVKHPRPDGKGFGARQTQKVLYLHGPGATPKLTQAQVTATFSKVPWVTDYNIIDWHYLNGSIRNSVEEIHVDPKVQEVFAPYGPDFFSYIVQENLNRQDEAWTPLDEAMDQLADKLAKDGPFDGLCGFDMGGQLAINAARLAQEGDARFAKKFRFLMLFSTSGLKEMSANGMGALRPKAPLQIDSFISWSEADDARAYPAYEDWCLYIHPDHRTIITHDQGHRPPNIQRNTALCSALDRFLEAVQADVRPSPKQGEQLDAAQARYQDFWLPLPRAPLPTVPADAPPRALVVVRDPLGEHGPKPEQAIANRGDFPAQEWPANCEHRLGVYRSTVGAGGDVFREALAQDAAASAPFDVLELELPPELGRAPWHPAAEPRGAGGERSRWVAVEDEAAVPWADLRQTARSLLEQLPANRRQPLGIVGLGAGSVLAWALAEALIQTRQEQPIGLWMVLPPTIWPALDAPAQGALVTTPVHFLTTKSAVTGPPWRLETSTFGPFAHSHFESREEMARIVADQFCSISSAAC